MMFTLTCSLPVNKLIYIYFGHRVTKKPNKEHHLWIRKETAGSGKKALRLIDASVETYLLGFQVTKWKGSYLWCIRQMECFWAWIPYCSSSKSSRDVEKAKKMAKNHTGNQVVDEQRPGADMDNIWYTSAGTFYGWKGRWGWIYLGYYRTDSYTLCAQEVVLSDDLDVWHSPSSR